MTTWARSLLAGTLAIALMLSMATQFVAWAFDQHPAMGEPLATVNGVKLYAPWRVLVWTVQWLSHDAWRALLHLALAAMCLLAAFGLAALIGAVEPMVISLRFTRPGFARWSKLRQGGLLRGDGLALGAARRHAWAADDIVRVKRGHALMLGATAHTDDALIAAMSSWRGALVLIEARDLSSRLSRKEVIRFAPGRADAIAINPLLAMRGGAHAWSDALTLARGFLRTDDGMLIASFAVLALDTLAHAPTAARSLSGMRQALADPGRRLAEFCTRWAEAPAADLGSATGELVRVARIWRRDGEAALRMLRDIDARLRLFADGDHALATEAHQLRLSDLVSDDGASSLVIQMPPGRESITVPLVSALLAQLVAACAPASDLDHLGRRKQRELLVVIEANALAALIADPDSAAPAQWPGERKQPPLFAGPMCGVSERGVRFLVQAACASDAGALIGADDDMAEDMRDVFPAIAALGPQTKPSAAMAAALAGQVRVWRPWKHQAGRISRWLFPHWERADEWVVAPEALWRADAGEGLLLMAGLRPIRCRSLVTDRSSAVFLDAASIARAPHDWDAPSLPPVPVSASAAARAAPPKQSDKTVAPLNPPIGGAKLRRVLARRVAPAAPTARGEQLI
ncbi:MAG: hypothetical protein BroJett013_12150 [Alphaproteobacteria bacterium]|nr:MAG: hypothetical protein BroJett013_12150 [Alphaproteobacteria bacterium]